MDKKTIIIITILEFLIMGIGLIITPQISIVAKAGIFLVPILQGGILLRIEDKRQQFSPYIIFYIVLCIFYILEIALEYILVPQSTKIFGIIEYTMVGICILVFIVWNYINKHSLKMAITQTIALYLGAMYAWTLANVGALFLFWKSERQYALLAADGTWDDFMQNGKGDYMVYVVEDYVGGAFFHTFLFLLLAIGMVVLAYGCGSLIRYMMSKFYTKTTKIARNDSFLMVK